MRSLVLWPCPICTWLRFLACKAKGLHALKRTPPFFPPALPPPGARPPLAASSHLSPSPDPMRTAHTLSAALPCPALPPKRAPSPPLARLCSAPRAPSGHRPGWRLAGKVCPQRDQLNTHAQARGSPTRFTPPLPINPPQTNLLVHLPFSVCGGTLRPLPFSRPPSRCHRSPPHSPPLSLRAS